MVHQSRFSLQTSGHRDMHDLTAQVAAIVTRSGIKTGTVHVFNVGSTAAVGMIEFEIQVAQGLVHPAGLEPATL